MFKLRKRNQSSSKQLQSEYELFLILIFYPLHVHAASIQDNNNSHSMQQPRTRPSNLKVQANNPIYDGVMYETMPGESFKCLLSPTTTSTSNTPLADSATRYELDQNTVPSLPPPRKSSVCQKPTLESVEDVSEHMSLQKFELPPHTLGDEYMVLHSPPTACKKPESL